MSYINESDVLSLFYYVYSSRIAAKQNCGSNTKNVLVTRTDCIGTEQNYLLPIFTISMIKFTIFSRVH